MTGELWAVLAGSGFGLFQTFNRRAVDGMDVYLNTFAQLLIAFVVFIVACLITEDLNLLRVAPVSALLYFAAAVFFHFVAGWTFLNASQKRVGAARTSPLIGATPLFATVVAAVTLNEFPGPLEFIGIGLIMGGAYLVSREHPGVDEAKDGPRSIKNIWHASWLGLSAALCWSISPVFIRAGLNGLPSPLLGVTIVMAASVLGYGVILLWQRDRWAGVPITTETWGFKLLAGVLVGLSTWMRWIALGLAPVAIVLALTMVSTPLVILLSPLVSGKQLERVTTVLWSGTGLLLGGALMLTLIA